MHVSEAEVKEISRLELQRIPDIHLAKRHHFLAAPELKDRFQIVEFGQGSTRELTDKVNLSRGFISCFLIITTVGDKKYLTHVMPSEMEAGFVSKDLKTKIGGKKVDRISVLYNPSIYPINGVDERRKKDLQLIQDKIISTLGDVPDMRYVPLKRPKDVQKRDWDIIADKKNLTIWTEKTLECNDIFDMNDL